ncbi:MAG: F0F1 ATP synthase subunit A [Chloroflexota bacterium]|jgi:F-type H+-transporting ATPase subunit a
MEIHASLKAEEVFFLGSVGITNSMVMTWLAMALLVGVSWSVTRNLKVVPSGMQSLLEYALEFIFGLVIGSAGQKGRRFFPLIATIFLFIITANYMALLPGVGTISVKNPKLAHGSAHAEAPLLMAASADQDLSVGAVSAGKPEGVRAEADAADHHEPETIHIFRAANADFNMTLGMGLIAFLFIHGSGIRVHGFKGFLEELATPAFLTPVKIMIEGFVPISLSMRLFGNVFGGEMLMAVMNWPLVAIPFIGMELLFGFIQAIIFSMLTLIFTVLATTVLPGHGGHGEAHGQGGDHH